MALKTFAKPEPWNVNPAFLSPEGQRLSQGLIALIPAWGGGGQPWDYVRRQGLTVVGAQEWAHSLRGMSLYSPDLATDQGGWHYGSFAWLPLGAATVLVHKRKRDGTNRASSAFGTLQVASAAGDAGRLGAHVPFSDGTVYWDFAGFTSGTSRLSVSGLTFGEDVWVFSAGPRGMDIWQNGLLRASQSGHATRLASADTLDFRIGTGNSDSLTIKADNAEFALFALWDRQIALADCQRLSEDPWPLVRYDLQTRRRAPVASAALTGTATEGITEADVVAGGKTIIVTLTNDTWVAAGATFDAARQAIIDGLNSAQSELTGWNAEVRDKEVVTAVVRTSDTVVTITLSAAAAYDITAQETITVTVPATAVVGAVAIVGEPTFTVSPVAVPLPEGKSLLSVPATLMRY